MTQLPVNPNDATTGHKLQGASKDCIIITSWPKGALFKNFEYTVISRVQKMEGLYLLKPTDLQKSFKPSSELKGYLTCARRKEAVFLHNRETNMAWYYSDSP